MSGGVSVHDRKHRVTWVDLLTARCTPEYFRAHAALGAADETPIFIFGMPRSGTTLVEHMVGKDSTFACLRS
jgi:Sulfotransferase family